MVVSNNLRAGEMAQLLRVLAALSEDPSSVPSPNSSSSQSPVTPAPGDPTPSKGTYMAYTQIDDHTRK